jgi:hypothetical protein
LTAIKRWLTLVEVYAEMPQGRKGIHLYKVLVLIFQFLPQLIQLLSSELPITPLARFPIIGSHGGRFLRLLKGREEDFSRAAQGPS